MANGKIDLSGYASAYGQGPGAQGGEAIGRGLSQFISNIPTRQERFDNFETSWFNDKFTALDGNWNLTTDGKLSFGGMKPNPNYDRNLGLTPPNLADYGNNSLDPEYKKAKARYNTLGRAYLDDVAYSPLNQDTDYKTYLTDIINKFGERKVKKFGLADPVKFAKKHKELEYAQALQLGKSLKELKYTSGDKWDNDKIWNELQDPKNKPIYDMLTKHGVMGSDPDLNMIQKDAMISDYLGNPFRTYWSHLSSGKVKDIPYVLGPAIAGALGYKFLKGNFFSKSGKMLNKAGVLKNLSNSKVMSGIRFTGPMAAFFGIPWAVGMTAEQLGSLEPEWWQDKSRAALWTSVGVLGASKIASRRSPSYTRAVTRKFGKGSRTTRALTSPSYTKFSKGLKGLGKFSKFTKVAGRMNPYLSVAFMVPEVLNLLGIWGDE